MLSFDSSFFTSERDRLQSFRSRRFRKNEEPRDLLGESLEKMVLSSTSEFSRFLNFEYHIFESRRGSKIDTGTTSKERILERSYFMLERRWKGNR
jgi:hypothetical protein